MPKLIIVLYHEISWEEDYFQRGLGNVISPDRFSEELDFLSHRFKLLSTTEAISLLKDNALSQNSVCLWFDDGYAGVYKYALPILKRKGITAAMSICSRFILHQELFWKSKITYLYNSGNLSLLRTQLKKLGYSLGISVKQWSNEHFSLEFLNILNDVFTHCCPKYIRDDAWRSFMNEDTLRKLISQGWLVCNHTSAHYPVENLDTSILLQQFQECDNYLADIGISMPYLVLPFYFGKIETHPDIQLLRSKFGNRIFVCVGNKPNFSSTFPTGFLYRNCQVKI